MMQDEAVIEECESLEWRDGLAANGRGESEVGEVELFEERIRDASPDNSIDASASHSRAVPVDGAVIEDWSQLSAGAAGEVCDGWSGHGEVESPTGEQYRVSPAICIETLSAAACSEFVFRIGFEELVLCSSCGLPGVALADDAVEVFDGAGAAQFAGEPVEQFGVIGDVSHSSKVTWRIAESASEVVLPDAVCCAAPGKWIFGGGDPVGECGAACGFGLIGLDGEAAGESSDLFEGGECSGGDDFAGLVDIAAFEDSNFAGFVVANGAAFVGGDGCSGVEFFGLREFGEFCIGD
jgi:hypothetical protein